MTSKAYFLHTYKESRLAQQRSPKSNFDSLFLQCLLKSGMYI
jgi:hypothetical protein